MNIRTGFLTLVLVLFSTMAFGGAKAVISGPKEAKVGDLVILDATRSEGLAYEWVLANSDKTYLPVENGTKLVFSSGDSGEYIFVLVVGGEDNNKKMVVSTTQHKVMILGKAPCPPTPDNPVPPKPDDTIVVPDGEFKIAQKVFDWAKATNDKDTALKISGVFEAISAQIVAGGLESIEGVIKETANKNKEAAGNKYEIWKTKFFTPLNVEMNKMANDDETLTSLEQHATCWKEIALGLKLYGDSK